MISKAEFKLAREAGEHLDHARTLLLSPTLNALQRVTPALEASLNTLARLEDQVRATGKTELGAKQELGRELRTLKKSLRAVERLMAGAAAFHSGWAGLIGAAAQTYCRTGQMQEPVAAATTSVRG